AYVVGLDIDRGQLMLARSNTEVDLVQADARLPPLRPAFDAAVGDPPYGRMSLVEGEAKKLFYEVLETLIGLIKNNSFIILAFPIYFDINLYSCAMYIHGGLYRVIYIVQSGGGPS
ncbi:MAG: RNA methyltransferase, partial [Thermoproteus sp.]|nr:RNA methyltransferase [Thermoproteus sp.]